MNRYLSLFGLFIALFFGYSSTSNANSEKANQSVDVVYADVNHYISGHRQQPLGGTMVTASQSQRVSSSRPTRVIPTNGGKSSRLSGRWLKSDSFIHLPYLSLLLHRAQTAQFLGVTSPRSYYVIALRHLLC